MTRSRSSSPRATRRDGSGDGRELRRRFPDAELLVADDGSRDGTADEAEAAGARVLRLPHRGKGQALTLAEREARPGPLLLCDADLRGDLRPLLETESDLTVAGLRAQAGRRLRPREAGGAAPDRLARPPTTRGAALGPAAAVASARGPGASRSRRASACETAMTIDAARAGLTVSRDVESISSIAPPAATSAASSTAAASSGTSCSRSGRRDGITAACGCRSSAGSSASCSRACCRSPRSVSPTTCGAGRSAASAPTSARARRPACSSSSASPRTRSGAPGRCPERSSSASPRTCSTSSTRSPAGRSRPICWRRSRSARRRRQPSCSRPTIFARWRCSVTPDRIRSAPC